MRLVGEKISLTGSGSSPTLLLVRRGASLTNVVGSEGSWGAEIEGLREDQLTGLFSDFSGRVFGLVVYCVFSHLFVVVLGGVNFVNQEEDLHEGKVGFF